MSQSCLSSIDVFVLAGGLGTRIRPVLGDTPKLLAPIAGRPYLDYLLDWLKRYGTRRVVLGLGVSAQAIIDHIRLHPPHQIVVEFVVEPKPLGTAGALRFARGALGTDPVLVINGDSFTDVDLCQFLQNHRNRSPMATLLCARTDDAGRYGRVEIDRAGLIQGFTEKDPAFHGSAIINAGAYLISGWLLDDIAAGSAVSLEHDVFERLAPGTLAAFTECSRFIDIGTPESLARAAQVFQARSA